MTYDPHYLVTNCCVCCVNYYTVNPFVSFFVYSLFTKEVLQNLAVPYLCFGYSLQCSLGVYEQRSINCDY